MNGPTKSPFSGRWPKHGMTRSGVAYQLERSAHPTDENAYSSLLPTPTAQQDGSASDLDKRSVQVAAAKQKHGRIFGETLEVAVALLPTPGAMDWVAPKNADNVAAQKTRGYGVDLREAVLDL
jgi:hypothetical protein